MFSKATILALAPLLALTLASPASGSNTGASTLATSTRRSTDTTAIGTGTAAGTATGTGTAAASTGTSNIPVGNPGTGPNCMTQSDAEYLVNSYIKNIAGPDFNATEADRLIAEGATETSQTVLSLGGATGAALQAVNAPNKTALLATERDKAFHLDFTLDGIDAVGCNGIGWRFRAFPIGGPGKVPFRGMSIFTTAKNETLNAWQITAVYGEVNSFLLDQDLGGNCKPLPPPSSSGSSPTGTSEPVSTGTATGTGAGETTAATTDKTTAATDKTTAKTGTAAAQNTGSA